MQDFLRLQIFLLMNLNWKSFYLIQKGMLLFSFSITYASFRIFVRTMFEHLFFIYLNCFLRIIIFLLFYYVMSLLCHILVFMLPRWQ